MKHHEWHLDFKALTLLLFSASCVSVKIATNDGHKQSELSFQAPASPFESISLDNADKAWQNKKTGSTLSYLSQCKDNADPSLESLRDTTLRGLDSVEILKDEKMSYNGREAVKTQVKGKLDGVSVLVRLLIFKKNFCRYTISMVGVESHVDSDVQIFETFLGKFEAP